MLANPSTDRGQGQIAPNEVKCLLESALGDKVDIALGIDPSGAGDGTGGLHFAKGDALSVGDYAAMSCLAAFFPVDEDDAIFLPFRNRFGGANHCADGVCAVIGDVSSRCTISASALEQRRKIPLVSLCGRSSSSDCQYAFTSWQGLSSYEQGKAATTVCTRVWGASTVVVVLDYAEEYGISLVRQFRSAFERSGGRVLHQVGLGPHQYDMRDRLAAPVL